MKITLKEKLMLIKAGYSAKEIRVMEAEPDDEKEQSDNNDKPDPDAAAPEQDKIPDSSKAEPKADQDRQKQPEEPEVDYKAELEKVTQQLKELQQKNVNQDISSSDRPEHGISDIINEFL